MTLRWKSLTNHQIHLYLTLRLKKSLRCWNLFIRLLIKYLVFLGTPLFLTEIWELVKDSCIWHLEILFVEISCIISFVHDNVFLLFTICDFWLYISIKIYVLSTIIYIVYILVIDILWEILIWFFSFKTRRVSRISIWVQNNPRTNYMTSYRIFVISTFLWIILFVKIWIYIRRNMRTILFYLNVTYFSRTFQYLTCCKRFIIFYRILSYCVTSKLFNLRRTMNCFWRIFPVPIIVFKKACGWNQSFHVVPTLVYTWFILAPSILNS